MGGRGGDQPTRVGGAHGAWANGAVSGAWRMGEWRCVGRMAHGRSAVLPRAAAPGVRSSQGAGGTVRNRTLGLEGSAEQARSWISCHGGGPVHVTRAGQRSLSRGSK